MQKQTETKTITRAPLPWHIRRTAVYDTIRTEDDCLIAFVGMEPPPAHNARYLVRAANAHEALITAARKALNFIIDDNPGAAACDAWVAGICDELRAALALAEKE